VHEKYSKLFTPTRLNPNGCPIRMSLYINNQDTSYKLVNEYYNNGMEIGSHSVTHTMINTAEKLRTEAGEQKNNLATEGRLPIDQVVGWRSPNLQPAGDAQPDVLKALGYTYDISLTYPIRSLTSEQPWPYTLDFGYPYSCSVQPCPGATSSHPGFWEIPVNSLFNKESGFPCVYVDACRPPTQAEAVDYLWSNFENTYNGNRAPFGLHMHAAWFFTEDYLTAMQTFIDRLLALDDVYIVSAKQVLDWMRTPYNPSHQGSANSPVLITYTVRHTISPMWWLSKPPTISTSSGNSPGVMVTGGVRPPSGSSNTKTRHTGETSVSKSSMPPGNLQVTNNLRSSTSPSTGELTCVRVLMPPGNLQVTNTPQIIYITINGRIDGANYQPILSLLGTKHNPNNCPISATFFVPEPETTSLTCRVCAAGATSCPCMVVTRTSIANSSPGGSDHGGVGQLPEPREQHGLRPGAGGVDLGTGPASLTTSRTNCLNLNTTGIEYDSSLVTSHKQSFTWPFTLDYGCKHTDSAQCPQGGYPGLWEVPIVPLIDYKQQFSCTYADACLNHPPTSQDTFTYLMHNFNQALTSSRAPMGINLRREWFSHSHYWPNVHGLSMFLDTVLNTRNDVYVVSIERMLDWMRNPVGLDQIKSFQRWNC
ncbi:hypothetical protein BaRGS_00012726, partial [Batillaria attramentaria]